MRIPQHIGLIPDGNRRWATAAGLQKGQGYAHGLAPGLQLLQLAIKTGVKEITYYGFTTDNCHRPSDQVQAFSDACVQAVQQIAHLPVSVLVVGNTKSKFFPKQLLPYTTRTHLNGGGIRVNFLVNYGWEWDLAKINQPGKSRRAICNQLASCDISGVDLIIRWGGMRRLSGFLPVQAVYADFYVVDQLWPDFAPQQFYQALNWYQKQDITRGG